MKSKMNRNLTHLGNICSINTYNVLVESEDNEHYEFEVDADSYSEACSIADSIAQDMCINIQYIQVQVAA